MYQHCESAVWSRATEKLFKVNAGVRQGRVLSPLLFIIYLNRIIGKVNVKDGEAQTLAYADDVAVVSKTVTQLQEVLSMLNDELYREHRYEDQ